MKHKIGDNKDIFYLKELIEKLREEQINTSKNISDSKNKINEIENFIDDETVKWYRLGKYIGAINNLIKEVEENGNDGKFK